MDRRKELKLAYKQNPPPPGVYQIKNQTNGKVLIGSAMDIHGKFNSWRFQLEFGSHINKELQADWNLYGPEAFTFEVLETIKTEDIPKEYWRDAVTELEEKWLNKLQPYGEKGYNKEKRERN